MFDYDKIDFGYNVVRTKEEWEELNKKKKKKTLFATIEMIRQINCNNIYLKTK